MEEFPMVYETALPHLAKLGAIAVELNSVTDEFTEEIRQLDKELATLNLGVEVEASEPIKQDDAWVDMDRADGKTFDRRWLLGYAKTTDAWHIVVTEYLVELDGDGDPARWLLESRRALHESTRELRIAAASQLEGLLTKLAEQAQSKLDALKKVTDGPRAQRSGRTPDPIDAQVEADLREILERHRREGITPWRPHQQERFRKQRRRELEQQGPTKN